MDRSTSSDSLYLDNSQLKSFKQYSQTQIWNQGKTQVVPELTVHHNGNTLFQSYDPDFIPPLKFTDSNELLNEGGLYFDLVHEMVNLKMTQSGLLEKIKKARKHLANRIVYRVLPLLWKQEDQQGRDNELHNLINKYYNNLLEAGFPHILPSRDVNF
ncbi:hypothetical protein INT45_009342 [Circinella minor]|uniref:Uncharacterized protein n=1 Tax=Circinella minor TaxID=1195481 RepID=A0A8H7RUY0_9FUNG|nr:hypothetical protein INT45_009342 [Circinella minor]